MATISAPSSDTPQEEWLDADFDFLDGEPIILPTSTDDKDAEDEDWDSEMGFSSQSSSQSLGSASLKLVGLNANTLAQPQTFTIRPPLHDIGDEDEIDEGDEGVSTIKVAALQNTLLAKPQQSDLLDDFEDAFALPSDLTQLSLPSLPLSHRSSKNSLEWGDKDQTTSSQSSDAYSTLSLHDGSPSSNYATSVSAPDSETDLDTEDEDDCDGLVLPSALFESGQGVRQLIQLLESKKKAPTPDDPIKIASGDPEDDFESGLVISDDIDLSPSRLLSKPPRKGHFRSSTAPPAARTPSLRPPSRSNRSKSPSNPPTSSARQLQRIRLSPSPPLRPPTRSQTLQPLSSASPPPGASPSLLTAKPASLRGQKSSSALKPTTPPATHRTLSRKASLSALIEASHQHQSSEPGPSTSAKARYEEPTVASRAKSHKFSTSRNSDYKVPPTRPHTPSANSVALRLTMPAQTRNKIRPALSAVFNTPSATPPGSTPRATSPKLPRSTSVNCLKSGSGTRSPSNPQPLAPKVLRKPKRPKAYGDGTELDGFDDLPTDRDKEGKYHIQPKGYGTRTPGSSKIIEKPEPRIPKTRRESNAGKDQVPLATATNTLRRTATRPDLAAKIPSSRPSNGHEKVEKHSRKKKLAASPGSSTQRKPTLIRNLGGASAAKVVGDMRWNPLTHRWEGNDSILRDFDAVVGSSTRPALITQLTGSSLGSPCGSFTSGARIVGNMMFDPVKMCWISTLAPDEEEPDVFANLADDENDSDAWESKGGTIRAIQQLHSTTTSATSSTSSIREAPSPARSHTRTLSESGSDRGSRASMVFDVDESFAESCREAEERHRAEMKGWISALSRHDVFSTTTDRSSLYEIRALATRKY